MAAQQDPGTGTLGQATTGNSSTESEEDDDNNISLLSRSHPWKGKGTSRSTPAATKNKAAPQTSSPASSIPRSHTLASVARSSVPSKAPSSDSDSPPRPNKRSRTEGQDRGSNDSDGGAKRGELRWRGTKQPIKRGGRRF